MLNPALARMLRPAHAALQVVLPAPAVGSARYLRRLVRCSVLSSDMSARRTSVRRRFSDATLALSSLYHHHRHHRHNPAPQQEPAGGVRLPQRQCLQATLSADVTRAAPHLLQPLRYCTCLVAAANHQRQPFFFRLSPPLPVPIRPTPLPQSLPQPLPYCCRACP